jgi:hypothetical protein
MLEEGCKLQVASVNYDHLLGFGFGFWVLVFASRLTDQKIKMGQRRVAKPDDSQDMLNV